MKKIGFLAFFLLIFASLISAKAETWKFTNGQIYNGNGFVYGELCVRDGFFVHPCPSFPDNFIDLKGAFVLPPFGEGHHHTVIIGGSREQAFLENGIAYAWIMANSTNTGPAVREKFETPDTLDASLAMATFTDPAGHPVQIGFNFHDSLESMEGDWVHTVETKADVFRKWPGVLASNPDFIKLFLLNSENYKKLKEDENIPIRYRGLNPDVVPTIVQLAKSNGLRVAAHVRTAHDFQVALGAGVDVMAHIPGFTIGPGEEPEYQNEFLLRDLKHPERFLIDPKDAKKTAEKDIKVVTTLGDLDGFTCEDPCPEIKLRQVALNKEVQEKNLKILHDAGVEILVGSDSGEGNSVQEAIALGKKEVLSPNEIVYSLAVLTPMAIFPNRNVGCLKPGCEGSLVVLEKNPLENLENIKTVELFFKQGYILYSKPALETLP